MKYLLKASFAIIGLMVCDHAHADQVPADKPPSYPDWWFERDVVPQLNANTPSAWPGDYPDASNKSPVLVGQLKNMATAAYDQCVAELPPAAWASPEGIHLTSLVGAFTQNDNKAVANLGQLKNVASAFYDLLNAEGVDVSWISSGNTYPWTDDVGDDSNSSPASQGQLKHVFSFFNPIVLRSFDYAIVRYIWNDDNGVDLDTRTQVFQPDVSGLGGTPPTSAAVGWSRSPVQSGTSGDYVIWGEDNTSQYGPESVLLDFPKLATDYSAAGRFDVSLNAFWYGAAADGKIKVQLQTFSGGTMNKISVPGGSYDWENVGGMEVDNHIFNVALTTDAEGTDIDGEHVGFIYYDPVTKKAALTR